MHQKTFRRFMRSALDYAAGEHVESLPADIREAYRLPALSEALEMVHFPKSPEDVKQARRRFVYEELLLFQLKMQGMKKTRKETEKGAIVNYDLEESESFDFFVAFRINRMLKNESSMNYVQS